MYAATGPGTADQPATWGRMTMCEALGPSHAFLEQAGRLRLLLRGDSFGEVVAEGARALGDRMCGRAERGPSGPWLDVELHAASREKLLVDWLNRLLYLAGRERWAPVECELITVNDDSLHARVRGVALETKPRLGRAILPGSLSAPGGTGLQAEVILKPRRAAIRKGRR